MELYYWSPEGEIDEKVIREKMLQAYEDIHHYQYEEYFDRAEPDPEKLIQYTPEASAHPGNQAAHEADPGQSQV
ncbi:hypothetical protein CathTA2_0285 [Caldalkalibacillus thermarum TA2.A1]|uniref:Uncharacterized protein n=1 Tax=Caldalkalibacillus thermarum (strain TA2.A1) TaxID=986075 RepID=F5L3C4_CALTT|nr:hypothetical protein [Caldalkalibacillus thermarum]EGL84155.1 hypothetical protein CathTA2_0285 [Caldalkalibacillus thermarum TA2.A1]QZT35109.1 hypothetical protein HUR95_07770 [Caldalkalibacillus thermarum TA2.A1]